MYLYVGSEGGGARESVEMSVYERVRGDVLLDKEIMRINHRFGRFPRPVLFLVCPAITIKHTQNIYTYVYYNLLAHT